MLSNAKYILTCVPQALVAEIYELATVSMWMYQWLAYGARASVG